MDFALSSHNKTSFTAFPDFYSKMMQTNFSTYILQKMLDNNVTISSVAFLDAKDGTADKQYKKLFSSYRACSSCQGSYYSGTTLNIFKSM